MENDLQYALMKAAYAAWDTNQAQKVDGHANIVVIPDTILNGFHAMAAAQGAVFEQGSLPKFWIEHEGRRAQIGWLVGPHTAPIQD